MNRDELKAVFDQQAATYDKQWARMAPITNGLYFLMESILQELPSNARILCVGVGTGRELIHMARRFPGWHFTAVEPSGAMLNVCRQSAENEGISSRCRFHEGYVDSLPAEQLHEAATCLMVSQFLVDKSARSQFFRQIAERLGPDGILINADLSSATTAIDYDAILEVWQRVMSASNVSPDDLKRIKAAYTSDVAVLPPAEVASIIEEGGFGTPVQFFQAALVHAWFAKRGSEAVP